MQKKWVIKNYADTKIEKRIFEDLEPITEIILRDRQIENEKDKEKFFYPDYDRDLADPFLMDTMKEAADRVLQAKEKGEKVCIYGDYDADGVTASVLLKDVFSRLEIENFCYLPDRNKEGYGINKDAIDYIAKKGTQLIVSVDCGVSSYDEIAYANDKNIDVVITDHHHVPEKIPQAVAVVNPHKENDEFPDKNLAGVGVAFKFSQALVSRIKDFDIEQLKWMLDLVAIGTVADCVELLNENRVLVKFGLMVLSKTKRKGLKQLFKVGRINIDENNFPDSQQISFQIAPRINAAGRLDHANTAYKLLSDAEDEAELRVLALDLESQNQRRQKVTGQIMKEVDKKISSLEKLPSVIVEKSPHWEFGVVGLAAGKLADKFNRPVIILQDQGETSRGSGRSIDEFNLIEALEKHAGLIEKYGGHSQAAGLTIRNDKLDEFIEAINQEAEEIIGDGIVGSLEIDFKIPSVEINEKLMKELAMLEPFGEGNPRPVFLSDDLEIVDKRLVGKDGAHLKLWLKNDNKKMFEAIGFRLGSRSGEIIPGNKISVVYTLEENNWNGNRTIQLCLEDFKV